MQTEDRWTACCLQSMCPRVQASQKMAVDALVSLTFAVIDGVYGGYTSSSIWLPSVAMGNRWAKLLASTARSKRDRFGLQLLSTGSMATEVSGTQAFDVFADCLRYPTRRYVSTAYCIGSSATAICRGVRVQQFVGPPALVGNRRMACQPTIIAHYSRSQASCSRHVV